LSLERPEKRGRNDRVDKLEISARGGLGGYGVDYTHICALVTPPDKKAFQLMKGVPMARRKKEKVEDLIGQLIQSELERELTKQVKRAKTKAVRQAAKLREYLQLPYVRDDEVVEAEVVEQSADNEDSTLKKTSPDG
jgi:hypothetical protein